MVKSGEIVKSSVLQDGLINMATSTESGPSRDLWNEKAIGGRNLTQQSGNPARI